MTLGWGAIVLWLLSFSWVPFVLSGNEVGALFPVIFIAELGALAAAIAAWILGRSARGSPLPEERSRAGRGARLGAIAFVLLIVLNVVGQLIAD